MKYGARVCTFFFFSYEIRRTLTYLFTERWSDDQCTFLTW